MTTGLGGRLLRHGFGADHAFRWRGGEISRLEGLSDAVFAFAVTLLVVSLEVPKTFDELLQVLRGFFAFAVCFGILFWVWYDHYRFSGATAWRTASRPPSPGPCCSSSCSTSTR
jgi:Endosomal/lysosomal potassium channel TMEM175